MSSIASSPAPSASSVTSSVKKRIALHTLKKEISLKVKDYDKKIRERNKKKLLLRKKNENESFGSSKRSKKSLKVIRATPVTPKNQMVNGRNNQLKKKAGNKTKCQKKCDKLKRKLQYIEHSKKI